MYNYIFYIYLKNNLEKKKQKHEIEAPERKSIILNFLISTKISLHVFMIKLNTI